MALSSSLIVTKPFGLGSPSTNYLNLVFIVVQSRTHSAPVILSGTSCGKHFGFSIHDTLAPVTRLLR